MTNNAAGKIMSTVPLSRLEDLTRNCRRATADGNKPCVPPLARRCSCFLLIRSSRRNVYRFSSIKKTLH